MSNILVIRNDKLGDFMLAWPAYAMLKKQYPGTAVVALVPEYTRPMAELCPWIDEIIIDERQPWAIKDVIGLAIKIRHARIDASISLFSETRTSLALWSAGVRHRFGPATKLAQIFLNKRLVQKRSRSAKPEYEYNTDLVRYFIQSNNDEPEPLPEPPFLSFDQADIAAQKQEYYRSHGIDEQCRLVCIHPGTGGSAINLSLHQYADLAQKLDQDHQLHFVITAGPGELEFAEALARQMGDTEPGIYHSTLGLEQFCRFIAMSDLFVSGSTGPLHIAGALDVPTAAFYPARKSATALRWQTLNRTNRRIAFSPEKYTGEDDMKTIDIEDAANQITAFLQRL